MNKLSLTGRIMFSLPFLYFGISHLINGSNMGGYVPSYIPGGAFWVYLTGLGFIAAAISIIINKYSRLAGILLAAVLMIFVLTMHLPNVFNPDKWSMSLGQLCKDFAMAGAALVIAGMEEKPKKIM